MKTKKLLCLILLQACVLVGYADQTITVSATGSDISDNLDLRTVATLFGQAKDLEQYEQMLNNPDSAFSNLDLNGDGQVDYLRVVETSDGDTRLVVLQAVLAKDVYQDVASIIVERDASDKVSVQVIGNAYIYGKNYIIEPVYLYRPLIYDWFWGPAWGCCWTSPWYWGYWPGWWYPYRCCAPVVYWNRCYCYHYYYPVCSYRSGTVPHVSYDKIYSRVSRADYATLHPENAFSSRNTGVTNARALSTQRRRAGVVSPQSAGATGAVGRAAAAGNAVSDGHVTSTTRTTQGNTSRTFGSSNIRSASSRTTTSSSSASSSRSTRTPSSVGTTSSRSSSTTYTTRSVATPTYSGSSTRTTNTPAGSSSRSSSSFTGTSSRSSSTYTGSSSRSSVSYQGGYSGGGSSGYSGSSVTPSSGSRGSNAGSSTRR